ncbi:hypothetical protein [Photobacterium indicum]|uniref:Uncharacterized protein n=1 Tax=Photobacterium indicum TaxID=81447 RepID=A0A2T3LF54_9GAMM|nr:hypothetical protein [Photobacterium indicum]PSV50012.1 hypothetical protein C9J47_05540 [Photobacterium indicum]
MHNQVLERISKAGVKTVKFDTGMGGGTPLYTSCDYAAALSGLSRDATAWIIYAYSNTTDPKSFNYLALQLARVAMSVCDNVSHDFSVRIAKLAMEEHVRGFCQCKGKGCEKCLDTGVLIFSGRLRASVLRLPKTTYFNNRHDYDFIIKILHLILSGYERDAVINITRFLS